MYIYIYIYSASAAFLCRHPHAANGAVGPGTDRTSRVTYPAWQHLMFNFKLFALN